MLFPFNFKSDILWTYLQNNSPDYIADDLETIKEKGKNNDQSLVNAKNRKMLMQLALKYFYFFYAKFYYFLKIEYYLYIIIVDCG